MKRSSVYLHKWTKLSANLGFYSLELPVLNVQFGEHFHQNSVKFLLKIESKWSDLPTLKLSALNPWLTRKILSNSYLIKTYQENHFISRELSPQKRQTKLRVLAERHKLIDSGVTLDRIEERELERLFDNIQQSIASRIQFQALIIDYITI